MDLKFLITLGAIYLCCYIYSTDASNGRRRKRRRLSLPGELYKLMHWNVDRLGGMKQGNKIAMDVMADVC